MPDNLEDFHAGLLKGVTHMAEKHKKQDAPPPFVFVLDSVASLGTLKMSEIEPGDDKKLQMAVAAAWSDVLRKPWLRKMVGTAIYVVLLNQLRTGVNFHSYGPPEMTTPGGKVLKFNTTTRIRLANQALDKSDKKDERKQTPIGELKHMKILKTAGPPGRHIYVPYYYHFGFDNGMANINYLLQHQYLKRSGAYIEWNNEKMYKPKLRQLYYKDAGVKRVIDQMAYDAFQDLNTYTEVEMNNHTPEDEEVEIDLED